MAIGEPEVHRAIISTPEHDVFWIFTLWRALHGGDPTLSDVAAAAIASLAQFLPSHENSFGLPPLPMPRNTRVLSEPDDSEPADPDGMATPDEPQEPPGFLCYDPSEFSTRHYYFRFKGVLYQLDRPAIACLPTAA
jgi:hypothetical protein